MNSIAWIIEVVSSCFDAISIDEIETLHVIDGETSGGAGAIEVWSWNIWEHDFVLVSGEDGIDFRLSTGEDELSALAPVLNWSPLAVNEKMLGDGD